MSKKMSANDFQSMRDFYIDVLRMRNYDGKFYHTLLADFDEALAKKDMNKVAKIMSTINVELV